MSSGLVEIKLHGALGAEIGDTWNLCVNSIPEALRAIHVNCHGRLFPYFFEAEKRREKYQILVDDKEIDASDIDPNNFESVCNSELMLNRKFEKLDIVPVIEGGIAAPILMGIGLMGAGMMAGLPLLIMVGLGLVISGMANLLAKPPDYEEFREFTDVKSKGSYLFSGPQNTVREGGPVPVGYGRLLVGSQLVGASYDISYVDADDSTSKTSS